MTVKLENQIYNKENAGLKIKLEKKNWPAQWIIKQGLNV